MSGQTIEVLTPMLRADWFYDVLTVKNLILRLIDTATLTAVVVALVAAGVMQ